MRFVGLLLVAASFSAFPMPNFNAHAQTQSGDNICMARMTTGRSGGDYQASIVVNKASQGMLEVRGFSEVACDGVEAKGIKFTQEICEFAGIAPADVQAEFAKHYGATPVELCEASNKEVDGNRGK